MSRLHRRDCEGLRVRSARRLAAGGRVVSFGRRIFRRSRPQGGILIPREMADRGTVNWPKCAKCMRAVDAYGIENETEHLLELWCKCSGSVLDPTTGQRVFGTPTMHEPRKSSFTIVKTTGWSDNRFTDIVRRIAMFSDDGQSEGREFTQTLTQEGVRKKDTV